MVAILEHWLWPFNIGNLANKHPDYTDCDSRLNETSSLKKGCGGVGLIWKKSLNIIPMMNVKSDRFCAAQLMQPSAPSDVLLTIISIYMPCSNYSIEEYNTQNYRLLSASVNSIVQFYCVETSM